MISSHVGTISSNLPRPATKRPNIPWVALLVLVVIGLISYRATSGSQSFDWGRFRATLASLDPKYCVLAILFIILSYWGRAFRWEVMIRPLGPTPGLWRLFIGTTIGFTAIVLLGPRGRIMTSQRNARPQ